MIRRVSIAMLQYGLALFVAVVLNFALPRIAPGNPIDFLVPPELAGSLSPEQRAQVLSQFGLDQPVPIQFERYLSGLAHGDLAYSVRYGRPVSDLLIERLPWTLLLVGSALLLSGVIGTLAGFWSAWRRGKRGDVATLGAIMLIDSMPAFFVGMLLILLFSITLGLFPIYGALPGVRVSGAELIIEVARRLFLPLVTLTLAGLGSIYLVARSSLVSEMREDYVLMAEAKGLSQRQVRRHAQRNAMLPVATIILVNIGTLVGGATVVETVFAYPGLGRLIYESVISRDYPVLQGAFLLLSISVITANLVADVLYPLLDPRVRRPAAVTSG